VSSGGKPIYFLITHAYEKLSNDEIYCLPLTSQNLTYKLNTIFEKS